MLPNTINATNAYECQKETNMSTNTMNSQSSHSSGKSPKQKVTILYARLSKDDEMQGPSNSIINQQNLLQEFAESHGLNPYLHIADDGWSGTRWDRPGWQELIAKIEADEVSCICIKDSSRLGRDYLRVGLYREMFRDKGVRLIAINDNLDTARGDDDFTPFREIMAEWYARDASKKIKSVYAAKAKSGKPTTNNPPYGFIKDPNDKDKWLVDPEAASVVKKIFQMTVEGKGIYQIASTLATEQVERPSYYLAKRGRGIHKNTYDQNSPYNWCSTSVSHILKKPEYAGHQVNLRSTSTDFKKNRQKMKPTEDWIIFHHAHEAIVDQETFDTAQKLRATPRRSDTLGEANPLTGLLWCADCHAKMYNHRQARMQPSGERKKVLDVYNCSTNKLGVAKFQSRCSSHHISTSALNQIILEVIRQTCKFAKEHEQMFVEQLRESSIIKKGETAKAHKKVINKNSKRLAEIERIYKSLYEDKALGKIGEDTFNQLAEGYQSERVELAEKIELLQAELDAFGEDNNRVDKFLEMVKRYTTFETLTPAMLNEFVDKVFVHEGEWSEGNTGHGGRPRGTRTQQVDVHLKYIGNFAVPDTRTPAEIELDRIAEEKSESLRAYYREKTRRGRELKIQREADTTQV